MPLVISAGETKTFQIQADSYKKRPRHYAGGKFIDCAGVGCQLCAAGVKATGSYALPILIGGVADEWIFPLGVSQQLDTFTQQGYKLLGLVVKVTRTGTGTQTRYQVALATSVQPVAPSQPGLLPGAAAAAVTPAVSPSYFSSTEAKSAADKWARLTQRLLMRRDFLDVVVDEVQRMKNEGAWG